MKSLFTIPALIFAIAHGILLHLSICLAGPPLLVDGANPNLLFYSSEGPSHFLVVEKKSQKLKLFEQGDSLRLIKEYTCATGQNIGNKQNSGDSRTPEGVYFITAIYEDKKITVFGSRAFHLDYPNIFDSHAGRLGDGIFIHGTNKKLTPNSTNGCITLDNRDLDELAPYLSVASLPVIILNAEDEATFSGSLSLEKGDDRINDILSRFTAETTTIPMSNITRLSSLQVGGQAVLSLAYWVIDDQTTRFQERRRAYLAQSASGKWRTLYAVHHQDPRPTLLAQKRTKNDRAVRIADNAISEAAMAAQVPPPASPPELSADTGMATDTQKSSPEIVAKPKETVPKPTPAPATKPSKSSPGKPAPDARTEEVLAFIEKWRSAWTAKDLESYMDCYSPTFRGGDLNKEQWRAKKSFLNGKYKFIRVKLSDINVSLTPSTAKVTFHQTYRSDHLQASGIKTLQLVNRKNRWLIEKELM
jgi:murein L,D-transpeptidase YafK